MYCYVKESRFIDALIQQGRMDSAKRWFNTWRYIDDLCGFGDRETMWQEIAYGMEHIETTEKQATPADSRSQVVFLGMKIQSDPQGITLSVQPKGDGWAWLPQRFIEYSSCHTHYTKWYLFHGLLVRALTICSGQEEFLQACFHYAQGLIARGFPHQALKRSWNSFCYSKVKNKVARRTLTLKFVEWVSRQDFSGCQLDEEALKKQRKQKTMGRYISTLACGMHALNHILRAFHRPVITAEDIHSTASEMAEREEVLLHSADSSMVLDLALDPRGNYPVDTLLHMLQSNLGLPVVRWDGTQAVQSTVLLVGTGQHWQAVVQGQHGEWCALDQSISHALQDLHRFLTDSLKHGAVYEVVAANDQQPDRGYIDIVSQPRSVVGSSPPVKKKRVTTEASQRLPNSEQRQREESAAQQLQFAEQAVSSSHLATTEGNPAEEDSDAFQVLLEEMTPDPSMVQDDMDIEENANRPQRERRQTHLYQSDEVALLDKKGVK